MAEGTRDTAKLRVFISYSRDDLDFADQLFAALVLTGFDPAIDRHGISAGEDFQRRLGNLICEADSIVFVLSPSSTSSEICAWEVEESTRLGKRIIPVVCRPLEGASPPPRLKNLDYIFFYPEPKSPGSGFGSGMTRLVTALNSDLDWLREHTRLLARAMEWEAASRVENRLLSGGDIAEAKAWAGRRPKGAPEPTAFHLDFIMASEAWEAEQRSERQQQLEERERLVREAEAAQRAEASERAAREAAQQKAAKLAKREAEQARRVAHRTFMGLVAAMILAVTAASAGYYAWTQQQDAVMQAERAEVASQEAQKRAQEAELQRREASRQKEEAEARKREMEKVKEQAQIAESHLLMSTASPLVGETVSGDAGILALLSLEALPDDDAGVKRPFVPEAKRQLGRAMRSLCEGTVLAGHSASVLEAAFSPDGDRIVTASEDKTARLWDAATGRELARLEHTHEVESAEFSPDGSRIVTASKDSAARVWDAATGKELVRLEGHTAEVVTATFSPDSARIVTASKDSTARVWDAATGKEFVRLEGHTAEIITATFSPDGVRIITGAKDATARVWDAGTGSELFSLEGHGNWVDSAAFSPDGSRIVTASSDYIVRVWDAATGEQLAPLKGHEEWVRSVAFSPNGILIVTASKDHTARVWEAATGKQLALLEIHSDEVMSATFSPDGSRLVTASLDGSAWVWEPEDNQRWVESFDLKGHMGWVISATFSSDGSRIMTTSADTTARVWAADVSKLDHGLFQFGWDWRKQEFENDTFDQDLVDHAKSRMHRCLTPDQRKSYFLSDAPPLWCIERRLWPYHTEGWQTWLTKRKAWLASGRQGLEPELPKD